jgi:hypothetical protein
VSAESDRITRTLSLPLAIAACVMLGLAGLAFWPQYLSRIGTADAYTHLHAALGLVWLLVLIAQPLLIRARKFALHRTVGRYALVPGAAFVIVGLLATHRGANRMDAETFAREGYFLYMPLVLTALFAAALVLAWVWRAVPAAHARFMACTPLAFADPLLARILAFYLPPLPAEFLYQVPALLVVAGVQLALLRTLPATAPGRTAFRNFVAVTIAALLLFFVTSHSTTWFAVVSAFRSLPIT